MGTGHRHDRAGDAVLPDEVGDEGRQLLRVESVAFGRGDLCRDPGAQACRPQRGQERPPYDEIVRSAWFDQSTRAFMTATP